MSNVGIPYQRVLTKIDVSLSETTECDLRIKSPISKLVFILYLWFFFFFRGLMNPNEGKLNRDFTTRDLSL